MVSQDDPPVQGLFEPSPDAAVSSGPDADEASDEVPLLGPTPPMTECTGQSITGENPWIESNVLSRETFSFLNPLLKKGYKEPLENADLYACLHDDSSKVLSTALDKAWQEEVKKENPSFSRALARTFGWYYFFAFSLGCFEWTAGLLEPFFATRLFDELRKKEDGLEEDEQAVWLFTGLFLLASLTRAIIHHPFFTRSQLTGMRMRIASTALIYKKVLHMSSKSIAGTTTGHLVNLISNDTERFDQATIFLHFLIIGPLKAIVVGYMLYHHLSWPGLVGVGACVMLTPLQYAMGKAFGKLRRATALITDTRVKYMNEVIAGIRLIKMYAWEVPYASTVRNVRSEEEAKLRTTSTLRAVNAFIFFCGTPLIMYIIIAIFIHTQDEELSSSNVFASMMYINALRFSMALFIPEAIKNGSEGIVSINRIQNFLLSEDYDFSTQLGGPSTAVASTAPDAGEGVTAAGAASPAEDPDNASPPAVSVENATCTWPGSHTTIFEGLNLSVKEGELVGIYGPVGAGKTSLFSLLTGELVPDNLKRCGDGDGVVSLAHRPTIATQEVWLTSDTVRNNILFGREFDEERYSVACEACGLYSDFVQFTDGDQTMIGDRGITLSGGQKARIGLARACYEGGDLFLLDDPLSAVDTVVGRHIVTRCISGILRSKTRILITHQHQFLPHCDRVFEITADSKTLVDRTSNFANRSPSASFSARKTPPPKSPPLVAGQPKSPGLKTPTLPVAKEKGDRFEMIAKEDRNTGGVTWRTYTDYFRHGGVVWAVLFWILLVAAQTSFVMNDIWLTMWVDRDASDKDNTFHFKYYSVSVAILCVLGWSRAYIFYRLAITASTSMHNAMFRAVVHAPCTFFDSNPTGRVLNRFSKDVGQMDELLPWIFFDCMMQGLICLGAVVVVSMFNPWALIAVFPILGIFIFIRIYFVATGREVKRLEALNRSPLYSIFSETINGVNTIRSYGRSDYFHAKYRAVQDDHTSAYYLFVLCNRWIGFRLDLASWLFVMMVSVAAVLARDSVSSGEVAVSITYAVVLSGTAQWTVRQSAELENMMTATERVRMYGALEAEGGAADTKPDILAITDSAEQKAAPRAWPSAGRVEFRDFSMRYREGLPLVLDGVSFTAEAGMKIGVVGRTGAGKSSLMQAIFRLSEGCGGAILIDGRATSEASLHELRSGCSVIPQDPVLFTGSLRYNVDPFGSAASDRVIWNALRDVQLQQVVEDLPGKLDFLVKEGGKNFSVGQRQLICLARAILRDNKVLVMDEATANVDPETDLVVQETVKRQFKDCTVITIAHRLHTVIESDRILVLARGQVMAYGDPHDLLQDDDGILTNFVEQTGDDTAASLRESARLASMRRSMSPVRVPY